MEIMQMTRLIEFIIGTIHYNENNHRKKTFCIDIKCSVKLIHIRIVGAEH